MKESKWIQGLVERFGASRVRAAGLVVLGYPPTLIHTQTEALVISEFLTGGNE